MQRLHYGDDLDLAQRCLSGENNALQQLQENVYHKIISSLVRRGASMTEAEDIMADLWGDLCIQRCTGASPLLRGYAGRSSLFYWLSRIAVNRLVDLKRKDKFHGEMPPDDQISAVPAKPALADSFFQELLRNALLMAFSRCEPEAMVVLRLVYIHGLSQRDVGRAWGWHESKVSRFLKKTTDNIRIMVLGQIKVADPRLHLTWDDVLEVCETCDVSEFVN